MRALIRAMITRAGASPAPTLLRSGLHLLCRVGAGLAPALVNTRSMQKLDAHAVDIVGLLIWWNCATLNLVGNSQMRLCFRF